HQGLAFQDWRRVPHWWTHGRYRRVSEPVEIRKNDRCCLTSACSRRRLVRFGAAAAEAARWTDQGRRRDESAWSCRLCCRRDRDERAHAHWRPEGRTFCYHVLRLLPQHKGSV